MAPRFFVPSTALSDGRAQLEGEIAHRIARVLHAGPGDLVELCDGSGTVYQTELTAVSPKEAQGQVVATQEPQVEPNLRLTLYQAVIRERRMAWLLEKGTEIGIVRFVPLITAHTVRAKNSRVDAPRLRRWERIVAEAAEQSRRTRLPAVTEAVPFSEAIRQREGVGLICAAANGAIPILEALSEPELRQAANVALFVGPEGDWTSAELADATERGLRRVTLGRRTLRSETAGIVASALVLAALDARH